MKAIMVMFDSLNRHMLSSYGCDWIRTPNFKRLEEKTVKFTNAYAGSLPCMPARRELHTGRLNFLHRSWGPLEPFDDSMPEILSKNGVYTHLVSDHAHYWEEGGANYHTKYSSWEIVRGQEGDPWKGEVADPQIPDHLHRKPGPYWRRHWVNRKYMTTEESQPQHRTFESGLDFIKTNANEDDWFLQIESFDPHEPFYTLDRYKKLYPHGYEGPYFEWPPYRKVRETPEQVEHMRFQYAAVVSMCDYHLGKVLDLMDELNLWSDTMLIVNTDHGFLLGEHEWWAKCNAPFYNEVVHLPLFIWNPVVKRRQTQCDALVQTIDVAPTILEYFNVEIPPDMQGLPLRTAMETNKPVREAALFGIFGGHINCTDGRYVYMRAPTTGNDGGPFNYTLMPSHIRGPFSIGELATLEIAPPFSFTKGISTMRTKGEIKLSRPAKGEESDVKFETMLFDLQTDPGQDAPIPDERIESKMIDHMKRLMKENDAPEEQFRRVGL